jgi:hypothetical protein
MERVEPAKSGFSLLIGNATEAERQQDAEYFSQTPHDRVFRELAFANAMIQKILAEQDAEASDKEAEKK